ncbi:unnamed protein product [Microthlaspi erraticum]|uniref:MATH domain-containing protein n=1 Tax=Microthlaspi erraticum TaxID=1685480 RepID=A0A6D2JPM7_9BRAS|nr:unnamed protein product [Microthlaspi erraticum]
MSCGFSETQHWFDQKAPDWGFKWMFPLGKLKAKKGGFLVNGEVKIVAEIEVLEVIGKLDVPEEATDPLKTLKRNEDGAVSSTLLEETPKDLVCINGFQVLSSQLGLYYGLCFAWDKGIRRLVAEVDSAMVVDFVQTGICDTHPLSFLVHLCQKLSIERLGASDVLSVLREDECGVSQARRVRV